MDTLHYQSQTLLEFAYKALKNDIIKNTLKPGQKIILRELSERYGISETPIKQALNRLVSEGLVESIPRKGMKVRVVKWEEIDNLFEIRYMIETFYIKNVIKYVKENPAVLDKFLSIMNEHESVTQKISDINEYYRNYYLDGKFHQLYIKCAGNKGTEQIYNNLGAHGYMYYVYGRQEISEMIKGVEEHRKIYNAMVAYDENEMKRCIEVHIENAKTKIYHAFIKNQDD